MPNLTQSNPTPIKSFEKSLQERFDGKAVNHKAQHLNVSHESGRMHVAFDQDVEIPDLFSCNGR